MNGMVRVFAGLALALAIFPGTVFPQGVTGSISGNVTDSSGGRMARASVRAVNELTGEKRETTTDEAGSYLFPSLPGGQYRVEAELTGFRRSSVQGLQLNVNQNARVDIKLEVGAISQEVKVSGAPPLVDTREAQ